MKVLFRSIVFLLLLFTVAQAQQRYELTGRVVDDETGTPVQGAAVRVKNQFTGIITTNEEGEFQLIWEGKKLSLEVVRLGYERNQIVISNPAQKSVTIRLTPKPVEVAPVVIESQGIERVFENPKLHVYDYELLGDKLLVIIQHLTQKKRYLALINNQDSVLDLEPCPEPPGKLYRDCMGNVAALTKHYACQVFETDGRIGFFVDTLPAYKAYVMPCLAKLDECYYYRQYRFNNQLLRYAYYDADSGHYRLFGEIKDRTKIHQLIDPQGPFKSLGFSAGQWAMVSSRMAREISSMHPEFHFLQQTIFRPVHSPLLVLEGEVFIFNHVDGELRCLDKRGKLKYKAPVSYHEEKHWKPNIYADHELGEAYTLFEKNGYATLKEIDLETGELKGKVSIKHQFVMKPRVRNGRLYYLYRDPEHRDLQHLYRYQLKGS